jgi:hypothetical protein
MEVEDGGRVIVGGGSGVSASAAVVATDAVVAVGDVGTNVTGDTPAPNANANSATADESRPSAANR